MKMFAHRLVLTVFLAAAGLVGTSAAFAMDPMKPMSKSDCLKHAGMEKDATKKQAMMKECDTMAMKKDTMKSDTMKKSGTSDAMGTMAPKKK